MEACALGQRGGWCAVMCPQESGCHGSWCGGQRPGGNVLPAACTAWGLPGAWRRSPLPAPFITQSEVRGHHCPPRAQRGGGGCGELPLCRAGTATFPCRYRAGTAERGRSFTRGRRLGCSTIASPKAPDLPTERAQSTEPGECLGPRALLILTAPPNLLEPGACQHSGCPVLVGGCVSRLQDPALCNPRDPEELGWSWEAPPHGDPPEHPTTATPLRQAHPRTRLLPGLQGGREAGW